jgi:hypothetical protein
MSTSHNTTAPSAARCAAFSALLCAAIALSACTTTGTGKGAVNAARSQSGTPVEFAWTSTHAGMSGTMSATVAGKTYSGPFQEGSREVGGDDLDDVVAESWQRGWVDWGGGAGLPDWDGWGPYSNTISTQYAGSVVANLQSADGQRMRCRFQLDEPTEGMTGGGQGACRLDNGESVQARFPRR